LADLFVHAASWSLILGQAEGAKSGSGGGLIETLFGNMMIPVMLTMLVLYFLMLRPDQNKRKDLQKSLANPNKNDHVVTAGGIYGTVVATADPKTVTIRVDDTTGTKLKVLRSAISYIDLGAGEEAEASTKSSE
jgi:preprotein translocase subunit YajC